MGSCDKCLTCFLKNENILLSYDCVIMTLATSIVGNVENLHLFSSFNR